MNDALGRDNIKLRGINAQLKANYWDFLVVQ